MMDKKEYKINLLRYQLEVEQAKKDQLMLVGIIALIIVIFTSSLMGGLGVQKGKLKALKTENNSLQKQVEELTATVNADLDTADDGVSVMDIRKKILNYLEEESLNKTKILEAIFLTTDSSITLGKMNYKTDNTINISAYCQGQTAFINYLAVLKELDFVTEVKNLSSKYNNKTGEVNFSLTLVLQGRNE